MQEAARTIRLRTRKFVRDPSFGGYEMLLQVEHRKVGCDWCGRVRVEKLEFVEVHERITDRPAIDMWEPYIQAVGQRRRKADLVFELFHVVKAFNRVIGGIRNEEFHRATRDGQRALAGGGYAAGLPNHVTGRGISHVRCLTTITPSVIIPWNPRDECGV